MKDHVTRRFSQTLEAAAATAEDRDSKAATCAVGVAYIQFFSENPQYYQFMFERTLFDINPDDVSTPSPYGAYETFRRTALGLFEQTGLPPVLYSRTLIQMWALVHGIAGISVMPGVTFSGDWPGIAGQILMEKYKP